MVTLLTKIFIRDSKNTSSPAVRQAYGMLCGTVGIVLNLLLFAGKFFAGLLSGSIAITADAFNNLSDAGSSIITFGWRDKSLTRDIPLVTGVLNTSPAFWFPC